MRRKIATLCSTILIFGFFGQAIVAQDKHEEHADDKFDVTTLQGDWKVEKGMKAGAESEAEALPKKMIVGKDNFTMEFQGDIKFVSAYEVDSSKSPMAIDFEITEGPSEEATGSTAKGIFKMEDGKLTLCYHPMGGARPEKFESSDDNGCHMFVMSKAAAKFDAKNLVGTWVYSAGTMAGQESGDERLAGDVEVDDDSFTFAAGPDSQFVMSYKIDSSKSPATIDLKIESGPVSEGEAAGIIKFEDGQITFCYHPTGGDRPTKFESTEDNGCHLFVLEKQDN